MADKYNAECYLVELAVTAAVLHLTLMEVETSQGELRSQILEHLADYLLMQSPSRRNVAETLLLMRRLPTVSAASSLAGALADLIARNS